MQTHVTGVKRRKTRASKSPLALAFTFDWLLIGWESGTSPFNQSQSAVGLNQSKGEMLSTINLKRSNFSKVKKKNVPYSAHWALGK